MHRSLDNSKLLVALLIIINLLSVRSGKYTYIVNLIFFISLFVFYKPMLTNISSIFLTVSCYLALNGIIEGNKFNYILEDFLTFSPLIYLILFKERLMYSLQKKLIINLANSLYIMLPISIVIYLYMDYSPATILTDRFSYNINTNFHTFSPVIPLVYSPILIFFLHELKIYQKFIVHFSNIILVLFGLYTLSKSNILNVLFAYILYYLYMNTIKKFLFKQLIIGLIFIFVLFYFLNIILMGSIYSISEIVYNFMMRIESQIELGDITSGRILESEQYLNQGLSFKEYIIGRGYGGQKVINLNESFVGGISMMHIGPLHSFLKGGILLTLCLYLLPMFAIWNYFRTVNFSFGLFLIWFLITGFQTTAWSWGIIMFFYWYSLIPYLKFLNCLNIFQEKKIFSNEFQSIPSRTKT
jgi:hypothetical protein